jgi:hypothetical protein
MALKRLMRQTDIPHDFYLGLHYVYIEYVSSHHQCASRPEASGVGYQYSIAPHSEYQLVDFGVAYYFSKATYVY